MKTPTAGRLRHKVRFERQGRVSGSATGNTLGEWGVMMSPRSAELLPLRGGEIVTGDRNAGQSFFQCWVRADRETTGIRPDDRFVDVTSGEDGRIFNITFAEIMDAQRHWLLIQAEVIQGKDGLPPR